MKQLTNLVKQKSSLLLIVLLIILVVIGVILTQKVWIEPSNDKVDRWLAIFQLLSSSLTVILAIFAFMSIRENARIRYGSVRPIIVVREADSGCLNNNSIEVDYELENIGVGIAVGIKVTALDLDHNYLFEKTLPRLETQPYGEMLSVLTDIANNLNENSIILPGANNIIEEEVIITNQKQIINEFTIIIEYSSIYYKKYRTVAHMTWDTEEQEYYISEEFEEIN